MHKRFNLFLATLVGLALIGQVGCGTLDFPRFPSTGTVEKAQKDKAHVYRSEEFAVIVLQGGETPARLAARYLGDAKKAWIIEDANEGIPYEPGRPIVIPLKTANKGGLKQGGYQVVPVLCYHRFAEKCRTPLCIAKPVFEAQMRYLKEHGYRVISMKAFLDFMYYKRALPKKSVLITIDDGHRSAYEIAYPILKKVGFRATLFVYTDFVGKAKGAVTWEQLREMKKAGFEVGSHTVSHCDLLEKHDKEDSQAYLKRVREELALSKKIIDSKLKQQTLYLAFPYGHHDQRILGLSEKMGYKLAFTVKKGGNPFFADPLVLKRTQVTERQIKAFKGYLKTFYPFDLKSVRE